MAIFRAPASDTAISHIVGYTISLISVQSIFLRGQIGTLQLHIVLSIYVSPLHPHLGWFRTHFDGLNPYFEIFAKLQRRAVVVQNHCGALTWSPRLAVPVLVALWNTKKLRTKGWFSFGKFHFISWGFPSDLAHQPGNLSLSFLGAAQ